MHQLIFRNWKFALVWVIWTMVAIGTFFAKGGEHKKFEQAAEQIREKRNAQAAPEPSLPAGDEANEGDDGFISDEELNSDLEAEENVAN